MLPENDTYGAWPLSGKLEYFLLSHVTQLPFRLRRD